MLQTYLYPHSRGRVRFFTALRKQCIPPRFDLPWTELLAPYFLGYEVDSGYELTGRIREAIVNDRLLAQVKPWPVSGSGKFSLYELRPIDVIEWAIAAGLEINAKSRDWYQKMTGDPGQTPSNPKQTPSGRKLPPPLKPSAVAAAFDGLHNWKVAAWKQYLADPPEWLKPARVGTPGRGRHCPNTWNPITLALALAKHDSKDPTVLNQLNQRFVTRAELKAWRGEWEIGPGSHL
jgi:hypothetical protein